MSKFQRAKKYAQTLTWKSYQHKDGTGNLIERPIRQLTTNHLLNILRTESYLWSDLLVRKSEYISAIFFILIVERGLRQEDIIQKMKELDKTEKYSRFVSDWNVNDVKKESKYYTNYFKKKWKQIISYYLKKKEKQNVH